MTDQVQPHAERPVTGWVVWMFFAGVMLVLLGVLHVLDGLLSLFRNELFAVRPSRMPVDASYVVWGWSHLVLGLVLIPLGYAVLTARRWARLTAAVLAAVSALVNFAFLPAYPVWSLIAITLDLLIVYALIVHGGELHMGREHY
jgi:hypothetical protein